MKKIAALLLAVPLLAVASCGPSVVETSSSSSSSNSSVAQSTSTSEPSVDFTIKTEDRYLSIEKENYSFAMAEDGDAHPDEAAVTINCSWGMTTTSLSERYTKIDIEDEKVRQTLFDALQKCPTKAIYTVRGVNYATSIYSRSKSKVVNVYDKTAEREAKYRSTGSRMALPQSYEQDIVRMELQVKTEHLKYMARRGFARTVTNWINVDTEARYLEKLYGMFPKGDFFTLEQAESLIVSSKYSKTIKNNLIKFIRIIVKSNMDVAKTTLSYNTYRRYLNLLGDLGINPITIPDDCGLQYIKSPFTFPSPTASAIPSAST